MTQSNFRKNTICLFSALLLIKSIQAQPKKDDVLAAIRSCATYIADVILDSAGRSRCDYNLTEGKWFDYEVPWHTGQAVYSLLAAYKLTNDPAYLKAARRGGDYWISMEIKDHPVLTGMVAASHGDFIGGENYVFATVSDGTPGIFELSRVTKDSRYARVATNAASWMLRHMYYPEKGVCYDVIDAKTGAVMKENSPFWQTKDTQTLNDVSRPNTEGWLFKDAWEFSGEKKFRDAFLLLCNSLVEKQGPEGLWMDYMPNFKAEHSFHPRFNLWYAESLLEAYDMTKEKKYLEAAAKVARVHARAQEKDGTQYYEQFIDGREPDRGSICGSTVAFSGIIWIRLVKAGYKEFEENIQRSANWILKNRYATDHPDPNLRGGVIETRARNKKGKIWIVNRDVATSFGVRFLVDYLHYQYK
ncbi:MAG: hypothetical protein J7578_07800 [Chitinophagaceae bacterium]|nr:hypothetical protein [Chitinophagaceae bacterium]